MPNVPVAIELSCDERDQLEAWTRRRTSAQALAVRSRIVLLAAEGLNNTEIADRLGIHRSVATRWRRRLAEQEMPVVERETVDSAVRQVGFLDGEIAAVERVGCG